MFYLSGFTFEEVGCRRTRNNRVTCCHFFSDRKLLASAGHDKKEIHEIDDVAMQITTITLLFFGDEVVLWNMDTLQTESTSKEHKQVIIDVRFRPNSSQLATALVDKSMRLWDATNPSYSVHAYTGHSSGVMSKKTYPFCFRDNDNEICYWNISPFNCARVSKGGTTQVRFQPRMRQLLAAASDNVVSIFDVETDRQIHSFQNHLLQAFFILVHATEACYNENLIVFSIVNFLFIGYC